MAQAASIEFDTKTSQDPPPPAPSPVHPSCLTQGAMEPFIPSIQAYVRPAEESDSPATSSPSTQTDASPALPSSSSPSQEPTPVAAAASESDTLAVVASAGGQEVVPYTSAEVECWPVTWITPAPPSILPHDVVLSAQMRARVVADRLGLSGLCQLDCLVHAGSGESGLARSDLGSGSLWVRPGLEAVRGKLTRPVFFPESIAMMVACRV